MFTEKLLEKGMNSIYINFRNCYGIKELEYTFDFSDKKTYLIYSPNGVMKTSFAKAFSDLSNDEPSRDLVFESETIRTIKNNEGQDLNPEEIFVIDSYRETFKSDKISTLLVNTTLKNRYETIHANIDLKKELLLKELKPLG